MVNVLLKKQLFEIFRSYFYDAKKNRPRSRASTILFFVLYAVLMIGFVGGMFVLLAWSICQPLVASGMGWLYFTLFAGLAILLGVFGSVFNTFSSLYQAKDNDLLLSMPIPIRAILASRLLGVYLMGLMFSGVVLLPAVIFYWCAADASPSAIAGGVMLVLAVSLFVLVLSCVLGWVVAKISAKLKRKNFLTVFIALVFFGLYYMVCFRASDLLNELLANLTAVGDAVRGAAYPLYLLGRMGEGDWLAIAFVMAVTLALCALTYLVLSRTFIGIATASGTTAKAEYREKAVKAAGASSALLRKEFGRFTSSPNYMLNCALGTVMLPIMGVLLLVKAGELLPVVYEIAGGEAPGFLAVMLCAALCLIGSMNDMTASSVSLEGKNLWLAQSLPVTAWQLLRAKLLVQLLVTGIPMAVTSLLVLLAIRPALQEAVLLVVLPLGVCAAVYLTEYAANKKLVAVIEYAAETLSGIPSIIYGLVGQMFFCQFLGMKKSLIAGAMTLVIMNLPTIMRTTQESLKTVPQSYREGAFGLGAGKWRTIRTVVLPGCVDGVITGCILAVGRILGETAALLYTAGFAHTLYGGLRETLESSGATLSVALYVYAKEQGEFEVAFAIAAILMVLALLINLAATLTGRYFKKRRSL